MYQMKKLNFKIQQRKIAKEVGITEETLSRIINQKQNTTKMTAYCITKAINNEAEINDYFNRQGEI